MPTKVQIKAERDYAILTTLALLDMASRSQLQKIHNLGSNRNATRILKNLTDFTNHFRDIENVYYLNKRGRELVGCQKVVTKTPNYLHILMRNDIYIHFGCPKLWHNEYPVPTPKFTLVPDAVFNVKGAQYFLEVDRMQKMNANLNKLEKYKAFHDMGEWQKRNGGRFPIVLFYTTKDSRRWQLIENNPGIQLQVMTKEDLI